MKRIKVETDAFVFSDEELYRLVELLKYCRHRILDEGGIIKVKWAESFVDYMITQLSNERR